MRLAGAHGQRHADHEQDVANDYVSQRRFRRGEHKQHAGHNRKGEAAKRRDARADSVVDAAGKHADDGIDNAAGQHDKAGEANGQQHAVLVELRQDVHGRKGNAEVEHYAQRAHAEARDGEHAQVDNRGFHVQLALGVYEQCNYANYQGNKGGSGSPAVKAGHANAQNQAAKAQNAGKNRNGVNAWLGKLVGVHLELQCEYNAHSQHDGEAEEHPVPGKRTNKETCQRGANGRSRHNDQCVDAHGGADLVRRNYLQNHGEHQGQNQTGAAALDDAAGERYFIGGGKAADKSANQERAQCKQGNLSGAEPFHQQARER